MFTGIDIIVIVLVLMAVFYANAPETKGVDIKLEPLTLLVVIIVVGMILVSLT